MKQSTFKMTVLVSLLVLASLVIAACSTNNSQQTGQTKFTTLSGKGVGIVPVAGIEKGQAIFARTDGPALKSNIYYAAQIIPDGKQLIFSEYYPRQADLGKTNKSIIYPLGGAVRFLQPGGDVKTLFRSKSLDGSKRPVMGLALNGNRLIFSRGSAIWQIDRNSGRLSVLAGSLDSRGFRDGSSSRSRFALPLAFARNGNTLYIADRDNFAVRALNLKTGRVSTAVELPYTPQSLAIVGDKLWISGRDIASLDLGCTKKCSVDNHRLWSYPKVPSRAIVKDGQNRIIVVSDNQAIYRFNPVNNQSEKLNVVSTLPQATGAAILNNRLYMVDGNKRIYSIALPR